MAIKAIIFDFVETLVSASQGYKAAEAESQIKLFEKLELEDWDKYKEIYRSERKEHFLRSDFSRKNVWIKLYSLYNKNTDNEFLDNLENNYWKIVQKNMKLFPETLEALGALKKNYKLGMITNSNKYQGRGVLDSEEYIKISDYFSSIMVSAIGDIPAKPHSLPFYMMLDNLEVNNNEAVFIGDDYRVDIEGSINAGLKSIWIKHYSVKRNWPENSLGVPVIDNLDKVSDVIELL